MGKDTNKNKGFSTDIRKRTQYNELIQLPILNYIIELKELPKYWDISLPRKVFTRIAESRLRTIYKIQ